MKADSTAGGVALRSVVPLCSYRCLEIALYHTLDQLPEPEVTHRFC